MTANRNNPIFATTHWSVVQRVSDESESQAADALEQLCRTYWYPLYVYVRRQGRAPEDAQDLTQAFFAQLLVHESLQKVRREKGRFRSFLLASMNHFLADEWDRAHRQKRGGQSDHISFDAQDAETRYLIEPVDRLDPLRLYERRWAMTVLSNALAKLEQECSQSEPGRWTKLKPFLIGEKGSQTYAQVGGELGMTEAAVKMLVSRLRQRCRELLREQIAETVSNAAEIEEEYRALLDALRS
jgi:RNA polymerase sigma factor (sigma-70 family)